jgi:GAF domain-containing protein
LKSYNILDSAHLDEPEFEFITQEAQKVFDCPIAIISLVDLGRQWFKSIQGLQGAESTPRCMAFCSRVIQQKNPRHVMVVPDATKDVRFQNNPLVTGGPNIRFYAGAALMTPEGQRIGTLCIIDTLPHPEGLDDHEQRLLQTMAQEVVLQMIMRTEDEDYE